MSNINFENLASMVNVNANIRGERKLKEIEKQIHNERGLSDGKPPIYLYR